MEFNLLSTKKQSSWCRIPVVWHAGRDKNSRPQAHQLKRQAASRLIFEINRGNLIRDPQRINKVFESYYTKLYTSEFTVSKGPIATFLDGLNFPHLESDKTA